MLSIDAIDISHALLRQIGRIDAFKGYWKGLEEHTTSLRLLSDVAEFGADFQSLLGPLSKKALSPEVIRILHAALIKGTSSSSYRAGEGRLEIPVSGRDSYTLETAAPEQIPALMDKLTGWADEALARPDFHPLVTIAVFTAVFLQIGPFETRNLALARFLIVLLMLKTGYSYAPYIRLDRIMQARGEEFYRALSANQTSLETGRPDWQGWLACFMSLLKEQTRILEERLANKEERITNLPALSAEIMALFDKNERLKMSQIIRLTGGRRSTIKLRLKELLEEGYLRRHGQARSTWYSRV